MVWDYKLGKPNPKSQITLASRLKKTVVTFINSEGDKLIVGL